MAEHTPEPWELTELESDDCGGEPVYRIQGSSTLFLHLSECSDGYTSGQNEANAYLIVQSPVLLRGCRAARDALRSYQYGNSSPDLAEEIANFLEKIITSTIPPKRAAHDRQSSPRAEMDRGDSK